MRTGTQRGTTETRSGSGPETAGGPAGIAPAAWLTALTAVVALTMLALGCSSRSGAGGGGNADAGATAAAGGGAAHVYELRGGRWLTDDGSRFVDRTVWVADSVFRLTRPAHIDSVVDLAGGYVVPPYGESHNHWLERTLVPTYVERYLLDGVFYVRDLSNSPLIRPAVDSLVNRPTSVDFIAAGPGFTGPGGHPLEVIDQLAAIGAIAKPTTRDEQEQYVFVVRNAADIARVWPKLMADHPDLVKVFLCYSEQYARRRDDDRYGARRGIDPTLVAGIVQRAHAAGLHVSAHIETAADFHNALLAGVDDIAHLPLYLDSAGAATFRIDPADARLAASRHVPVSTTINQTAQQGPDDTTRARRSARDVVRSNLRLLRDAGVELLVGSDQFRHSSADEARALAATGVFTPAALLHMWSQTTPQFIFPHRQIGRLADGAEASLLVLTGDPTQDFANTERIRLRMKQGVWLTPRPTGGVFPPLPGS